MLIGVSFLVERNETRTYRARKGPVREVRVSQLGICWRRWRRVHCAEWSDVESAELAELSPIWRRTERPRMLWLDLPDRHLRLRVDQAHGWFHDGWELEKSIGAHVPIEHKRLEALGGLRGWFVRYALVALVAPLAAVSILTNTLIPACLGVVVLLLLLLLLAREDRRRV
jgi:hypothetical protein